MFGWDQKDRLLRESWTADELAQELYAMFGDKVPSNTNTTVGINPPTGNQVAPIQLGNLPDNTPIISGHGPGGGLTFTLSINNGGLEFNGQPIGTGSGGGGGVPVWG